MVKNLVSPDRIKGSFSLTPWRQYMGRIKSFIRNRLGFNSNSLDKWQRIVIRFLSNLDIGSNVRYKEIVKIIKKTKKNNASILEIGPGKIGITAYLKQKVIGVDVTFDNDYPSLGYLEENIYNGSRLEYSDNSFDFVISVDVLEHVPGGERQKIIAEMLRVAKRYTMLCFPCSEKSQLYEKKLERRYARCGLPVPKYLKDHMEYILPDESETIGMIRKELVLLNITQYDLIVIPNENLRLWYLHEFLKSKGAVYYFPSMVVIKLLLCLMPFLASIGECYRKVIIIEKRDIHHG
jgi:hypothetical protein